ncbi:Spy/CpxP family protein refolding chaperone [Flavobacterium sp. 7A]|uniref:Spy/CpxP family protein refolding chaperone n=1 Tax=Flavobacterium sp. 7A TaxID=2940571 RepID=UPI0022261C9D|nr:hypothetical protein [Flavobacterium sp. 7A]MCW2119501.1 Spy/CpxP family protein refolding chaperone [Flavobacterium sp. 7A]
MNKVKILTISVIALVLLNIGLIVFIRVMKSRMFGGSRGGMRTMIIKKLDFDTQQQVQFEAIVKIHKAKIDSLDQVQKNTKESLFTQLTQPEVNENVKDSLITVLAENQKVIENAHFEHFRKMKSICKTPEQQEKFKALVKELGEMFARRRMMHQ